MREILGNFFKTVPIPKFRIYESPKAITKFLEVQSTPTTTPRRQIPVSSHRPSTARKPATSTPQPAMRPSTADTPKTSTNTTVKPKVLREVINLQRTDIQKTILDPTIRQKLDTLSKGFCRSKFIFVV